MSEREYVERVTLIKFMKDNTPNIHGDTTMRSVQRTIKAVPAAEDVVKVVRCENCKYAEMIVDIIGDPSLYCRMRNCKYVNFDDFCSWGERKDKTMADKEYIERWALLDKLKELKDEWGFTFTADGVGLSMWEVEDAPAADVVEVVHGHWMEHADDWCGAYYTCSACGCDWTTIDGTPQENNMKYCPECGAKMDGERKEQT